MAVFVAEHSSAKSRLYFSHKEGRLLHFKSSKHSLKILNRHLQIMTNNFKRYYFFLICDSFLVLYGVVGRIVGSHGSGKYFVFLRTTSAPALVALKQQNSHPKRK